MIDSNVMSRKDIHVHIYFECLYPPFTILFKDNAIDVFEPLVHWLQTIL
jgi:hypothetical protein